MQFKLITQHCFYFFYQFFCLLFKIVFCTFNNIFSSILYEK